MNFIDFNGKRGLIFGLANEHSIAWGCTRLAHALGAQITATCLNEKAQTFVEPLTQPLGVDLQVCDVENPQALQALVEHVAERWGTLDFVIHSIAWAPLQDLHGRVIDSSSTGFSRAMAVSCHSFATIAKLCSPYMTQGGAMVTMSYLGSDEAVPHYGLMGPVKAALESLVRYMALELGPQGIRVHAVSPGPIPTRAASGIQEFDALMQNNQARAPLRRLVTLDEIANLALFLCSDQASGMTGQTIFVDAGYHAVA